VPARTAKPMRQREGAPPRTAYTIREVAESLGLSTRQIYRLAESGELPTKRIGGKLLVLADDFQQFLAAAS
jgi:excisionase family DNA binding protein